MSVNHRVGIFDSGVGGFSVLKEINKNINADIIYYGDCMNAPYGNRSKEEIISFIKNIISHLKLHNVTHFVSACNSMSVHTTEKLLEEVGVPSEMYMDMVTAVQKYLNLPQQSNILIVGTQATISSGVYQEILLSKVYNVNYFVAKDLAQAIEEDNKEIIKQNVKDILDYAHDVKATHILYACTHYPLIHDEFENYKNSLGWQCEFIDPAVYVAQAVEDWNLKGEKSISFQTSKITPVFKNYKNKF